MDNEEVLGISELNHWDIDAYKFGINRTFVKRRVVLIIATFISLVLYSLLRYSEKKYNAAIAILIIDLIILIMQILSIYIIKKNILNKVKNEESRVKILFYHEYFHVMIENEMGSTNMKFLYKDFSKVIISNKYCVLSKGNKIVPLSISSIDTDDFDTLVEIIKKQVGRKYS